MIEVAFGVVLLAGAIFLYRKGAREDANYGSQGAVILLVVAAILLIHGFGALKYHTSPTEMEALRS
jgi:cbb3-type cytochrome oxidase subunit 3